MSGAACPRVEEVNPDDAWRILVEQSASQLIDVRTRAEWGFVGVPDLAEVGRSPVLIEWAGFPDMSVNPRFAAEVMEAIGNEQVPETLLFLCRSGARSLRAAFAVADHLGQLGMSVTCLNVAEGFEGDLDPEGHRGDLNGWKARGLAWRQS
ncbi:MAG: rhodanese-like domain-containing protein [Boseongicola sp.]